MTSNFMVKRTLLIFVVIGFLVSIGVMVGYIHNERMGIEKATVKNHVEGKNFNCANVICKTAYLSDSEWQLNPFVLNVTVSFNPDKSDKQRVSLDRLRNISNELPEDGYYRLSISKFGNVTDITLLVGYKELEKLQEKAWLDYTNAKNSLLYGAYNFIFAID